MNIRIVFDTLELWRIAVLANVITVWLVKNRLQAQGIRSGRLNVRSDPFRLQDENRWCWCFIKAMTGKAEKKHPKNIRPIRQKILNN